MNTTDPALVAEETPDTSLFDAAPDDDTATDAVADGTAEGGTQASPRTRWAGIIWGVVFAVVAYIGLSVTTDSTSLDTIAEWLLTLSAGTAVAYGLLALGALVLIAGVVAVLRRAQVALAARRGAT